MLIIARLNFSLGCLLYVLQIVMAGLPTVGGHSLLTSED
jgi:hypothetical protein